LRPSPTLIVVSRLSLLQKNLANWWDGTPIGRRLLEYRNRKLSQLQSREAKTSASLADCANLSTLACLEQFNTSLNGLTDYQIPLLLNKHGLNVLTAAKPRRWWSILLDCIPNPFNLLLAVLAVISVATQQTATFVILMAMVFLSTGLRFWQEMKSNIAANALKLLIRDDVIVIRNGVETKVPKGDIFPGDLVRLSGGDVLPADIVLVRTSGIHVSQSTLTGENMPVLKQLVDEYVTPHNVFDSMKLCFAGTTVTSGSATGIVVATGDGKNLRYIADDKTPTLDRYPKVSRKNKILTISNVVSDESRTFSSRSCWSWFQPSSLSPVWCQRIGDPQLYSASVLLWESLQRCYL
jgi:magnesium-transporting ATPase (P-type)